MTIDFGAYVAVSFAVCGWSAWTSARTGLAHDHLIGGIYHFIWPRMRSLVGPSPLDSDLRSLAAVLYGVARRGAGYGEAAGVHLARLLPAYFVPRNMVIPAGTVAADQTLTSQPAADAAGRGLSRMMSGLGLPWRRISRIKGCCM